MDGMNINSERTLCFLIEDNSVYLSKKVLRLGKGKLNGYGGGIDHDETPEHAAIRELEEESGFIGKESDLEKKAEIEFYFPHEPHNNQLVHVYFLYLWNGTFKSDGEMSVPEKFSLNNLPYADMWKSDKIWWEPLLLGKKIKAKFVWNQDMSVKYQDILEVKSFD